jgi:hypothetical protein
MVEEENTLLHRKMIGNPENQILDHQLAIRQPYYWGSSIRV